MKNSAYYSIQKQILDIRHAKAPDAYAKQTEIMTRYKREVVPLLEKVCRELCPGDRLVKIDTLSIDLPPMTTRSYKSGWAQEVVRAFRKSLSQAIANRDPQNANITVLNRAEADLQFLSAFLYIGLLPWSYNKDRDRVPETMFRQLIKEEPEAIRRLLNTGLRQDAFAKRLGYQFSESLHKALFSMLQPAHEAAVYSMYDILHRHLKKTGLFNDRSNIAALLGYHSLRHAAPPWHSEKHFLEQLIRSLAQDKELSYPKLLNSLLKTLKPETGQNQAKLVIILEKLYKEASVISKEQEEKPPENHLRGTLQNLLRQSEQLAGAAGQQKATWYKILKTSTNDFFRLSKMQSSQMPAFYKRLEKTLKQSLRAMQTEGNVPAATVESLKSTIQSLLNELSSPQTAEKDRSQQEQEQPLSTAEVIPFREAWQQFVREVAQLSVTSGQQKATWYKALKILLDDFLRLAEVQSFRTPKTRKKLEKALEQLLRTIETAQNTPAAAPESFTKAVKALHSRLPLWQAGRRHPPQQDDKRETDGTDELQMMQLRELPDEIYIENAGLVILWPFLTQLFRELSFTEKQRFIHEDKQYRAVHLLQYLAGGNEDPDEELLPLNKLLCGLPLSEPVPKRLILQRQEKEATEDVIKAATKHWTAVKNTSVEGFREAFLLREGKLSRSANGRLLRVNRKSYDVIMSKLPWSTGMLKLPWMPEILYVEW